MAKCSDFDNIFFEKFAIVLFEHIKINSYGINLKKNKQLPYKLIYSLKLVKLKFLKTYIMINFTNNFICFSKSFINILILFNQKLHESF